MGFRSGGSHAVPDPHIVVTVAATSRGGSVFPRPVAALGDETQHSARHDAGETCTDARQGDQAAITTTCS